MRVLVTRPQPDASAQARALRAMGHEAVVEPLLRVDILPGVDLPLDDVQAVVATSGNGLRAVADRPELTRLRALPLFTVGEGSAALAWDMGFVRVAAAGGTGASLATLVERSLAPGAGGVLHLAGTHLAFDLKGALEAKGYGVCEATLYRAEAASVLSESTQTELREGRIDAAILMSRRIAACFADLAQAHGLADAGRRMRYFCLSAAVADALGPLSCGNISVPVTPESDALLALIAGQAAQSC